MRNYHLKLKSEAPEALQDFLDDIGHGGGEVACSISSYTMLTHPGETAATIMTVLHSDNDTVFTSKEFQDLCTSAGMTQTFSPPGVPQQNGTAERAQRTIVEPATAMLIDANKPARYWTFAFDIAVALQNHLPRQRFDWKSSSQMNGDNYSLNISSL